MRIAWPATVTPTKSGGRKPAVRNSPCLQLHFRFTTRNVRFVKPHGGLTPAVPGADCSFVHRTSRNSGGGRTRPNKSGGVSPPVVREPAIRKMIRFRFNADRHKSGCGNAIATASANTLGDSLPSNCRSAFASALPIRHGELTPAALGYACDNRLRMCANYPRRRDSPKPRRAHAPAPAPRVRRRCLNLGVIIFARAFPTITAG